MITRQDVFFIGCLVVLALFIWLRDTTWISSTDDTIPILVALPLFFWFGRPWKLTNNPPPVSWVQVLLITLTFLVGIVSNLTIILATAWTLLLWTWLSPRLDTHYRDSVKKLLILPFLAFPWMTLDAVNLGWWFRLSGAWTTSQIYLMAGLDVTREGTQLLVNHLSLSIDSACAGLNTLQSMLIIGSSVAFLILGNSSRYWWNLPLLFVMAWLANLLRILTLSTAALVISPDFAMGPFHTWGGWFVLIIMFLLCWLIFSLQEPKPTNLQ